MGFFRRSVQDDAYMNFVCRRIGDTSMDGNCEINSKSWNSCRYCRFQKCVTSGLQIPLVLTPRQRDVRQGKRSVKNDKAKNKIVLNPHSSKINANSLSTASFADHEVEMINFRVNTFMMDYLK